MLKMPMGAIIGIFGLLSIIGGQFDIFSFFEIWYCGTL